MITTGKFAGVASWVVSNSSAGLWRGFFELTNYGVAWMGEAGRRVIREADMGREWACDIEGRGCFGWSGDLIARARTYGRGGAHVHDFRCVCTPPLRKGYSHFSHKLKP